MRCSACLDVIGKENVISCKLVRDHNKNGDRERVRQRGGDRETARQRDRARGRGVDMRKDRVYSVDPNHAT